MFFDWAGIWKEGESGIKRNSISWLKCSYNDVCRPAGEWTENERFQPYTRFQLDNECFVCICRSLVSCNILNYVRLGKCEFHLNTCWYYKSSVKSVLIIPCSCVLCTFPLIFQYADCREEEEQSFLVSTVLLSLSFSLIYLGTILHWVCCTGNDLHSTRDAVTPKGWRRMLNLLGQVIQYT